MGGDGAPDQGLKSACDPQGEVPRAVAVHARPRSRDRPSASPGRTQGLFLSHPTAALAGHRHRSPRPRSSSARRRAPTGSPRSLRARRRSDGGSRRAPSRRRPPPTTSRARRRRRRASGGRRRALRRGPGPSPIEFRTSRSVMMPGPCAVGVDHDRGADLALGHQPCGLAQACGPGRPSGPSGSSRLAPASRLASFPTLARASGRIATAALATIASM